MGCLALLMAGCNKIEHVEVPAEEPVVESPDHLVIDIKVGTEGETRAIKKAWEVGDKVYVFFDHFFLKSFDNQQRWDFIEDFFLGEANDELFSK